MLTRSLLQKCGNEEGVTLLEVLVAGSIGVVVAFAVAKTSINATQSERASELEMAQMVMMSRLQNAIDDPLLCPTIWYTWNTGTSTFDVASFNPTSGPPPVVTINRIVDGSPTDVARTSGAAGGPSTGLTIPTIRFTEPSQISENTYAWTLTITMTKVATGGGTFVGTPTSLRRLRLEVTTTGSPNYTATYCGPPVSPEANQQVPMLRFTPTQIACNGNDASKDAECAAQFSSVYTAATLQDLAAYRMVFADNGAGNAGFASQYNISVGGLDVSGPHIFTNSIDPAAAVPRFPGTIFDVKLAVGGETCHIPCIRSTAPLRFVRGFYAAGVANKTGLCQTNIGFAYTAATANDMVRYGFRLANGETGTTLPASSPGAIFDGNGGVACRMGYSTAAPDGPGLDCTVGGNFPLACVLR